MPESRFDYFRRERKLRAIIAEKTQTTPGMRAAFQELLHQIISVINTDECYLDTVITTNIPPDVKELSVHFYRPWKLYTSAWVDGDLTSDANITVEKYYESCEGGTNDDVWRVSGGDWVVTFLGHRNSSDDGEQVTIDYDRLWGSSNAINLTPRRYVRSGMGFKVVNAPAFNRDVLQWILSR